MKLHPSVSKHLEILALRVIEDTVSVKFYILAMSSIFFYLGKLDQKEWVELMLFIAGFKTLNNVVAIRSNGPGTPITASGEVKSPSTQSSDGSTNGNK